MRRFVQAGVPGNFFEVDIAGTQLIVRFGPRGRAARTHTRPQASEAAAIAERDRLIAMHLAKGYVADVALPPGAPAEPRIHRTPHEDEQDRAEAAAREAAAQREAARDRLRDRARIAREPALETACRAAPEDPAPWAIYADWLIEQGDPRGEIAARHAGGRPEEAGKVLALHRAKLCGRDQPVPTFTFRHGFAIGARFPARVEALVAAVRDLLAAPMADFLTELRVGLVNFGSANEWRPVAEAIAEAPIAAQLRTVGFDAYAYDDCMMHHLTIGNLAGVFERLPALEDLTIRGDEATLGTLRLPRLRRFVREATMLRTDEVTAIAAADWPGLEHLALWNPTLDALQPILDARGLPRLRHFGYVNADSVDLLIPRLVTSQLLPQLESLDLSMGTMSLHSTARLVEHAAAFRHLAAIDLSQNQLTAAQIDRIRGVLDNVITLEQREIYDEDGDVDGADDPELERHRYAAEYE